MMRLAKIIRASIFLALPIWVVILNSSVRKRVALCVLIGLSAALLSCSSHNQRHHPKAEHGVIDLSDWNFSRNGSIDLSGNFAFYWKAFVSPDSFASTRQPQPDAFVAVPGIWNGTVVRGQRIPGTGFGTYHLLVRRKESGHPLSFEFRDAATAMAVFIDGKMVFSSGKPGISRGSTTPFYRSGFVSVSPVRNDFDIVIHVANFDHRKGGLWKSIVIGEPGRIERRKVKQHLFIAFFFFCTLSIGLYHIALSILRNFDRPSLLLGICSMLVGIRSLTQGEVYLTQVFPSMSWIILLKTEYLSYYLAVPIFMTFLSSFFKGGFSKGVLWYVWGFSLLWSVFVLVTSPLISSYSVMWYHFFTILTALYALKVLFRCVKEKQEGALPLMAGSTVVFITVILDILSDFLLIHDPETLPFGFLIFFAFLTVIVAARFSNAFRTVEAQRLELVGTNERLINEILERKRIEEEKSLLQQKLASSQKMEALGLLAGGVAHDLNNIIVGVTTLPEILLLDVPQDSPMRLQLEEIRNAGFRAGMVVQDLLSLTRRAIMHFEPITLDTFIASCVNLPECRKLMLDYPHLRIKICFEEQSLAIKGSPVHLQKVLVNLLTNAAEAHPKDYTITVATSKLNVKRSIRGLEDIPEGIYVVLSVSDSGTGIKDEDLARIFEPFYSKKQLGRSGTGLGMAIVWGTVHDHSGFIDVKSCVDKGTTIYLYFPCAEAPTVSPHRETFLNAPRGNNESILVVDDAEEPRLIAQRALRELGYTIHAVASGEAAIEYVGANSVDLLILDMIMDPGIDGFETYKRILEIKPGTRAIIVSGFAETEVVKKTQELGAGMFLRKPYSLLNLATAVRDELRIKRPSDLQLPAFS